MLDDAQNAHTPDSTDPSAAQQDQQLIGRIAAGDRAAMGALIERHQKRVLSLSYRMLGRWDQAEEAAQEVFIKVYRAADKYQPKALFTTWLHRIVVNHCLDMRRRSSRAPLAMGQDQIDRVGVVPADDLEARERSERVRRAVAELPDAQKTALILHRFESQPIRQIAQVMERSESAVESLLVRAYARLRESLADLRDE